MSLSVVSQVRRGKLGFCYLGESPSPETPETLVPLPGTECSVVLVTLITKRTQVGDGLHFTSLKA